jgi:hypothetical protein
MGSITGDCLSAKVAGRHAGMTRVRLQDEQLINPVPANVPKSLVGVDGLVMFATN